MSRLHSAVMVAAGLLLALLGCCCQAFILPSSPLCKQQPQCTSTSPAAGPVVAFAPKELAGQRRQGFGGRVQRYVLGRPAAPLV